MDPWCCSDITFQRMEGLVCRGLLHARTSTEEWLLPSEENMPSPPDGYLVLFAHFHECGFTTPAHRFLWRLLHYYKIELQHLDPNRIQHMAAFVALCEGFLGISPHFDLWRYFFVVTLQKKREKNSRLELQMPMGCAGIHLQNNRVDECPSMRLSMSNKG